MITEDQLPTCFREIIDEQVTIYDAARSITQQNTLPETGKIPIENQGHWLRIPDVICVYVDMIDSTKLSASKHDNSTAGAYQLFTGTAVRLFSAFDAPYIDVRGDGVFALFNSNQPYRALAAAVTFKTFASEVFVPRLRKDTDIPVGAHIGIDQKTVLVRKIGLKRYGDRTDRQNEVWAGKPVNMAAKLAAISEDEQLHVSDRYFQQIQHELVTHSCTCAYDEAGNRIQGTDKRTLWTEVDVSEDERFDFNTAHLLSSQWCKIHGKEYCEAILALDDD